MIVWACFAHRVPHEPRVLLALHRVREGQVVPACETEAELSHAIDVTTLPGFATACCKCLALPDRITPPRDPRGHELELIGDERMSYFRCKHCGEAYACVLGELGCRLAWLDQHRFKIVDGVATAASCATDDDAPHLER